MAKKNRFEPSARAERDFYRALKQVAKISGHIVKIYGYHGTVPRPKDLQKALDDYAETLTPWATRQAAKLLDHVQKSNRRAYTMKSRAMGRLLQSGVVEQATGQTAAALLAEQVALIKSIPIEAGLRAQKLAYDRVVAGTRAAPDAETVAAIEKELGFSTEVAVSRALLIARTETARSTALISQTRAQAVGSRQYRWHNSGDEAVRPSHRTYRGKKLQGMIFSWDSPPTLDDGMTGHPGTFPNCRCFAEPLFEDE